MPHWGFDGCRSSICRVVTSPCRTKTGTIWIAFNGEVYNYRELKPQLKALGHKFRTASDTECLIHAYEQWGRDCVQHFRGMFAFAIWDDRRRTMFLRVIAWGKSHSFTDWHAGG